MHSRGSALQSEAQEHNPVETQIFLFVSMRQQRKQESIMNVSYTPI